MSLKPVVIPIKATDKTQQAFNSIKKSIGGLNKSLTSTSGKLLSLAGAAGFGGLSKKLLDTADRLGKVSVQTGVGTDALQKLQFAAGQSGVTTENLNKSLQQLSKRAGEDLQNEAGCH